MVEHAEKGMNTRNKNKSESNHKHNHNYTTTITTTTTTATTKATTTTPDCERPEWHIMEPSGSVKAGSKPQLTRTSSACSEPNACAATLQAADMASMYAPSPQPGGSGMFQLYPSPAPLRCEGETTRAEKCCVSLRERGLLDLRLQMEVGARW